MRAELAALGMQIDDEEFSTWDLAFAFLLSPQSSSLITLLLLSQCIFYALGVKELRLP